MNVSSAYRNLVAGPSRSSGRCSVTRGVLGVLSVGYSACSSVAEFLRSGQGGVRVDLPVISVGNLTTGGTGKTPLVSRVVKELIARGRRPVILSRGYASVDGAPNDEALVLARHHPGVLHLQDPDRVALARRAAQARLGDVIVLDDGFQHQALHRDLNICAIDATQPFGNGAQLPLGQLRESPSGLYRARPVVITRSELVGPDELAEVKRQVLAHNEHAKIVVSAMRFAGLLTVRDGNLVDAGKAQDLRGKSVLLASGIGNPDAFRRGVAQLGARVVGEDAQGDHHRWTGADVERLCRRAAEVGAEMVVTTLKDAVKLLDLPWPADAPPLQVLDVEVDITEGASTWGALLDETLAT